MQIAPSGHAHVVTTDRDELHVVEVGGTVRAWRRDGVDVLAGFGALDPIDAGRGQQLLPWPNRIRDGRYTFDGVTRQLPITEVGHGNASHGLLRWASWQVADQGPTHVTMAVTLHPQPGWEWTLACQTRYAVTAAGLHVTSSVTNRSETVAPFGAGWHPYVRTESVPVDDVLVEIPGSHYVPVDDRLLPMGVAPTEGTPWDLRGAETLGERRLDTAYTGLSADPDGRWRVRVALPSGRSYAVWGEASAFPWVQVFTGKAEAQHAPPHGIAVEPMTCPPDAFNSGVSLVRLRPGQTWTGSWGIETTPAT